LRSSFLLAEPTQVPQHNGLAQHSGQTVQSRIHLPQHGFTVGLGQVRSQVLLPKRTFRLVTFAIRALPQGLQSHKPRDPMEPAVQATLLSEASSLSGQHDKRRLRGILGIVVIAQQSPTRPIDHRTVPCDQFRKSRSVAGCDETVEEFLVGFRMHAMTFLPEHALPFTPMLENS
jgi:hypothetical protein